MLIEVIDPKGDKTTYKYDAEDRLIIKQPIQRDLPQKRFMMQQEV
jgi:YD repeat-containing protein